MQNIDEMSVTYGASEAVLKWIINQKSIPDKSANEIFLFRTGRDLKSGNINISIILYIGFYYEQ